MRTATALLTACGLAASGAASELRGRVTLAGGSAPGAGATVSAAPYAPADEAIRREAAGAPPIPVLAETTADAGGRFALAVPDGAGLLQLRISGEGLVPAALARAFVSGTDADVGEVFAIRAETLSGRVVGPAAGPVVGAEVSVTVANAWGGGDDPVLPLPQTAVTDAEGRFRVAAGERQNRLEVRALGLAPAMHFPVSAGDLGGPIALAPGRVLEGRVLLPDGQTPAAAALLRFETAHSLGAWHEAGPDGRFRLEDVAVGSGTLRVEAGERGRAERRVEDDHPEGEAVDVLLDDPVGLRGRAFEAESGRGVAGAPVVLQSAGRSWAVETDRDGRWSQPGLAPGTWEVRIEAAGFVPWRRGELRLGAAGHDPLDAALERAASLRGRVLNEDGEPVAGARCRLESTGETGWEAFMAQVRGRGAVLSDAEGRFELRAVAAGTGQSLLVEHDDYAAARLGGVDLVPGRPVDTLTVVLSRGLSLVGRAVDVDGVPVAGASVVASRTRRASFGGIVSYSSGDRLTRETDAEGGFAFHGLEATGYRVTASHDAYAAEDLGEVDVSDETQGESLEIVLRPGAAIRGVVRDGDGRPAAGYRVIATPAAVAGFGFDRVPDPTGPDGVFAVEGLEVGSSYDVQLLGDGSVAAREDGVVAPAEGLELRAPGEGRIAVVALDAHGAPLEAFEVSYQSVSSQGFMLGPPRPGFGTNRIAARVPDGRFVLDPVPAGTWAVEVRAEGHQPARSGQVVVEAGRTTPDVTVRLEAGHAIRGRVLDRRSRRPVAGARVAAETQGFMWFGPNHPYEGRTDAEGTFEIGGLARGTWTVIASHPDWSETSASVQLDGEAADVEVLLSEGSRIEGSVLSGNAPVGGAEVSLVVADDPQAAMRTNRAAVSDASGRFAFQHLAPGRYTVSARLRDRTGQGVEAVITADATVAEVVVPLDGGTRVSGTVEGLDADQLRQVSVNVSGPGGFWAQLRPGADGRFDVTGAPAGTVRVSAALGGWQAVRQVSESLVIAEGQPEATVVLRFDAGYRLEGRVSRGGDAVVGASLWLSRDDGGGNASGRTGADGAYAIDGLAEGAWTLRLRLETRASAGLTRAVEIAGDTVLDLELDTARIAGRVVDAATGGPVSGATVTIVERAEERWRGGTHTDSEGRFAVEDLEPGPYEAHVRKAAYQQQVVGVIASSASDVLVELERGEGIPLIARDGIHGTPLRALQVRIADAAGATYYTGAVLLDSEGRGELQPLPPGSYRLRAGAQGYAPTAELPLAVPSAELSLALTPGGALEVRAGTETLSRPGAGFTLLRPDGSAYAPDVHRGDPLVSLTGPVLRLAGVLPGDYRLVVVGGGSHEVAIREGATSLVDLP